MKLWDQVRLTEAGMEMWRKYYKTDPPRTVGKISGVAYSGEDFKVDFPRRKQDVFPDTFCEFRKEHIEPLGFVGKYKDAFSSATMVLQDLFGAFSMIVRSDDEEVVLDLALKDEELMTMYLDLEMVLKGKGLI